MTKTIARLLAAATLCALPATADAAVTYTLASNAELAASGTSLFYSVTLADPITRGYQAADMVGQTCSIRDVACTSLSIYPGDTTPASNTLYIFAGMNSLVRTFSGTALVNNGTYTSNGVTLTVSGLFGIGTPGSGGPAGAVPEPATWALMLAGFGLTGAALRRRRVRFAPVAA